MKQLLLQSLACCAVLLPFAQAEAKTFGGFAPGKTFTFKVTEKTSTKGFVTAPVPAGIPNYKVGEKVKFTIGAAGQLTAKSMSLPFKEETGNANVYAIIGSITNPIGDVGQVFKNSKNKPTEVSLTFFKSATSVFAGIQTVTYKLK